MALHANVSTASAKTSACRHPIGRAANRGEAVHVMHVESATSAGSFAFSSYGGQFRRTEEVPISKAAPNFQHKLGHNPPKSDLLVRWIANGDSREELGMSKLERGRNFQPRLDPWTCATALPGILTLCVMAYGCLGWPARLDRRSL
jgi:hypothetical protein